MSVGFDMAAANLGFAKEALLAGDAETALSILEPLAEQAPGAGWHQPWAVGRRAEKFQRHAGPNHLTGAAGSTPKIGHRLSPP